MSRKMDSSRFGLVIGPFLFMGVCIAFSPESFADAFNATGSMPEFREHHATVRLSDGKVLIAGGSFFFNSAAFLYNPATGTFSSVGTMTTAPGRNGHTLTLLATGKVLVAGGIDPSGGGATLNSAQLYDPATASFAATGNLSSARTSHTAERLSSGLVLLAGGESGFTPRNTAELYNPTTAVFSPTGSLSTARSSPMSALLPDGRVLVVGGIGSGGAVLASAEIYNPATGTWSVTGALQTGRYLATATALEDGRVLVVGGRGSGSVLLASAELYDPCAGTFSPVGSLSAARRNHTATLLQDGRVLVAGGGEFVGGVIAPANPSAELFDPATKTFSPGPAMREPRIFHTATALDDGRVLVAGGEKPNQVLSAAELFVPSQPILAPVNTLRVECAVGAPASSRLTGSMPEFREFHASERLLDGRVLVAGGSGFSNTAAFLYDPGSGLFSSVGIMTVAPARNGHTLTLLTTGRILVAGGSDPLGGGVTLNSAQLYDPATASFAPTGNLVAARRDHTATPLPSGLILLAGGESGFTPIASAERYNPSTGAFGATGGLGTARRAHAGAPLPGGKVLVAGGYGASGALASAEIYDPAAGTWSPTGALATARYGATATALADGRVLVAGGRGSTNALLASAEIYDPCFRTFSAVGSMLAARIEHTATLQQDGRVLLAGGGDASGPFPVLSNPSAELFDPDARTFSAAPAMREPRMFHAATLLADGRVLVTGGERPGQILRTAEIFEPGCFDLVWTPDPAAVAYDVVKGNLALLRSTGGDFTASLLACVEDDGSDAKAIDGAPPSAGEGFYYLVRGIDSAGMAGTYDSGSPAQVGSRDGEIAASALACP